MRVVPFPIRLIYWLLDNRVTRSWMIGIVIVLIVVALFPGAVYFYPFWKTTIKDRTSEPFEIVQDTLQTKITHPNRLIPGRSYRARIEVSNTLPFTQSQELELQLWKEDPHIVFENSDKLPIVFTHTFQAGELSTFPNIIYFSMDDIEHPYPTTTLYIRQASVDGTFITGIPIPIDFYSVPIIALVALVIPVLIFLLRKLLH